MKWRTERTVHLYRTHWTNADRSISRVKQFFISVSAKFCICCCGLDWTWKTTTNATAMLSTSVKIEYKMSQAKCMRWLLCVLYAWNSIHLDGVVCKLRPRSAEFLVAQAPLNRLHANSNIASPNQNKSGRVEFLCRKNRVELIFCAVKSTRPDLCRFRYAATWFDRFFVVVVAVHRWKFLLQLNESLGHTNNL